MVFTDDMYSFVSEDIEESLEHSSQWVDENGNNTPAYNHKYWLENRDTIMARRRLLDAGADSESKKYSDADADEYLAFLEDSVNAYVAEHRDHLTQEEQKLLLDEYQQEVDRVNSNRAEKKEESKTSSKSSSDSSDEDEDDSGSSKKSSGGSKGSSSGSGSSKSSSKSGGGSSSKGSGHVTPGFDPVKSGAKASSGSKDSSKSSKEGSGKEKSGSGSKGSSDKSSKDKEQKNQLPSEDNSPEAVAFSKIKESGYEPGNEPTNSYASFIREIRERTNYEVNDADTGLALWKEYRKRRGMDTSDELISKYRSSAEEEIEKRKSLQHGLDLFDYYSLSPDMQDGYDTFNELVLEHHGIMGMKWGVKNGPPYPLAAGSHNAAERKANWQQSLSSAGRKLRGLSVEAGKATVKAGRSLGAASKSAGTAIKKTAQNTAAEIHKHREESKARKAEKEEAARRAEQERRDAERRSAIASGNRQYADENFNDMSSQEINELLSRADLRAKVDKYNGKEGPKTFKENVDALVSNVNTARNWAETGMNAWNTFAKFYNTFNDDSLPVIGESPYDRAKKQQDRVNETLRKQREEWFKEVSKDPKLVRQGLENNVFNADEIQKLAGLGGNMDKINKSYNSDANKDKKVQERADWYIKHPDQQTSENFKKESDDVLNAFYNRAAAINNAEKASKGDFKGGGGGGKKPSAEDIRKVVEEVLDERDKD